MSATRCSLCWAYRWCLPSLRDHTVLRRFSAGCPTWFYPVVDYGFPAWDFEPSGFFAKLSESVRQYFLLDVGNQLIWVGAIVAAALAIIGLRRLYVARRNRGDRAIGDSEEG